MTLVAGVSIFEVVVNAADYEQQNGQQNHQNLTPGNALQFYPPATKIQTFPHEISPTKDNPISRVLTKCQNMCRIGCPC